jgi:2-phospho-L-lactate guanylyltransferase
MWAVVPVKPFDVAKRRLVPVLRADERAEFARLMLEDVLAVLTACTVLTGIIVVTRDVTARAIARSKRAVVLGEEVFGVNAAVATAIEFLSRRGDAAMIVVPSDIPLLPAAVIEQLAGRLSQPRAVALVPATRDGGTNLLACSPADAIGPNFGPDSFRRHCGTARGAGIVPTVLASEDAGLDIDRPEDVAAFLSRRSTTRSRAYLATLDLDARLQCHAHDPLARRQFLKA